MLVFVVVVSSWSCGGGGGGGGSADGVAPSAVAVTWRAAQSSAPARYAVHWGLASRTYTETFAVGTPPETVDGLITVSIALDSGSTYYFAVTAFDRDGQQSDYSNELVLDLR